MLEARVLDKIKKCLALSQSSEPAEAAAALRQAQKLMAIHGVSQADLGRADLGQADVKSKVSVSRLKDWELRLIQLIARAFGCKLLWLRSSSYSTDVYGRYTLIGLKAQVQLAQYTCEVLQRRLLKARNNFVQTLPAYYYRRDKTRQADGFCHGWVDAISRTVHDFALPEATQQLIEAELASQTTGEAKVQERPGMAAGYEAGREQGADESIHSPVANRDPVLALGAT